jgi:O-antigen ligase
MPVGHQLLGESMQPDLRSPDLRREMLRENEEPLGHRSSVTIARVTALLLRRAFDRVNRVPASRAPEPQIDERQTLSNGAPTSSLIRYATVMLAVTAACLPLYVVRWKYGPLSTTLLELLVVATIALYLFGRLQEGALRFHRSPYDLPIALLLLAGAGAVFVPPDRWHALGLYRAYFVEPIAIFYVGIDLLRRRGAVRGVLVGLGIGTSIFAALNVGAFFASFAQGTFVLGSPPTALYTSSPEVAMYLEPPFALAAGFVMFADRRRDRLLALAWMVFLTPALVLTLSRGAYLAIAVLAVVAIATSRARLPLAAAVVVLVVLLLQVPLVHKRLAGQFDLLDSQTTIRGRLSIFSDTLTMLRDHPIFGNGLGGYHYLFRGTILEIYPHDVWLTFWVEVGLLGMVAFAVIFFGLLYRGWRAYSQASGFYRALLWGVSGSLVLWGVHGLVDSPYWKNDMSIEFWILAAFELVAIRAIGEGAISASDGALEPAPRKSDNLI